MRDAARRARGAQTRDVFVTPQKQREVFSNLPMKTPRVEKPMSSKDPSGRPHGERVERDEWEDRPEMRDSIMAEADQNILDFIVKTEAQSDWHQGAATPRVASLGGGEHAQALTRENVEILNKYNDSAPVLSVNISPLMAPQDDEEDEDSFAGDSWDSSGDSSLDGTPIGLPPPALSAQSQFLLTQTTTK